MIAQCQILRLNFCTIWPSCYTEICRRVLANQTSVYTRAPFVHAVAASEIWLICIQSLLLAHFVVMRCVGQGCDPERV